MKRYAIAATLAVVVVAATASATSAKRWGYRGHEITGNAAATNLPAAMPAFFRNATKQLEYLNPEPDRWRAPDSVAREMNQAYSYDHYVDLEVLTPHVLAAPDRWEYWQRAQAAGVENVGDAGFLQYRIVELYQRLEREFGLWRTEKDSTRRAAIEARIINDAGILGHYVADAANPHHTSVHHDRWREGYPNPHNYTTERGFHGRFEGRYVETHIEDGDVLPHVRQQPRRLDDIREGVMQHINSSHALLGRLYDLDKLEAFGPETKSGAHKQFAISRLTAGADMLRDLWWTAWVRSGEKAEAR